MVRHMLGTRKCFRLLLMTVMLAVTLVGPALAPNPAAAGRFGDEVNCGRNASHRTLQQGSTGTSVRHLQCMLNFWGYDLDVDGIFGKQTNGAVRDFQGDHGLAVDGIVGPQTWEALHPDPEDAFPGKPRP